jgi:ABC-type multidrug transport system ATPase subunit
MEHALTTPPIAIQLDRVSRLYGNFAALREVSVSIPAGQTILLLGANGAGKSTLLKLLAGLASPSMGQVRIFGERPLDVRERIAVMSHNVMLYDELTARENLAYFAKLYDGFTKLVPIDKALHSVGLDPNNPRRVGEYSQGMRQRAALARTLMTSPDLLLLDEPFSNLDVDSVARMTARLQAFLAELGTDGIARTLVLTTHQRDLANPLNPTALTLHEGRLLEARA